jgi:hypothetical protein
VKALLAALAVLGGILWWRNRHPPRALPQPDPADELRAKLAEAREVAEDRVEARPAEPAAAGAGEVDARRQDVHERARAAMEDLRTE